MKCVGIIWNCALSCREEIFMFLDANTRVVSTFNLHLGDSFEAFVREIYPKDSIAPWKIEEKLKHMRYSTQSTDVIIVIFEIDGTDKFFHPYKHCNVNAKLELLKVWIRQVCKEKIADYFYDISFHCSDNEIEFQTDLGIIRKYKSRNETENG